MDKNKPLLSQPNWLLWIPLLISAVVLGAYAYVWNFVQQPLSDDAGKWGTFGDYFGGLLNPVIAACTLFVAMRVWQLQKTELQATQDELRKQAAIAEQQRGEQRFFDLLTLYQSTVSSITLVAPVTHQSNSANHSYSGKEAIAHFLRNKAGAGKYLIEFLEPDEWGPYVTGQKPSKPLLEEYWKSLEISELFDHYFRVVFRLLVESEKLLGQDHVRYAKLFRAQLSGPELTLIGFNLWLDPEGPKMAPIAEQYGLLKHLPHSPLRARLEKEFNRSVFGRKFSQEHPFPHTESCWC